MISKVDAPFHTLTNENEGKTMYVLANSRYCLSLRDVHTSQFLIHSSVDKRLGCLCVLAVVNNVAVYMGVQISL